MPILPMAPVAQSTLVPSPPSAAPATPAAAPVTAPTPVAENQDARLDHDDESLQEALRELNEKMRPWATNLRFELDPDSSLVIVQVIDVTTGDVLRQIPAEEVVNMSKALGRLQDLAFRASA